jgi:hypothetical protein
MIPNPPDHEFPKLGIGRAPFAGLCAVLVVLALAACAAGGGAERPEPAVSAASPSLEGTFRWTTLDQQPAPVEFPPGSGATLVGGTLELRGVEAAARDGSGRFGLRFTMRRTPADSARTTGEDGRFRIAADSLLFTPDGREDRPPVRFRYAWLPGGVLALTDAQGHVWGYVRQ